MTTGLDIRRFFQRAPREWLQRYFAHQKALPEFDWQQVGKRKVDPLHETWAQLGDDLREGMAEDFRNIELLATQAGKLAILDEARERDNYEEVNARLLNMEDFYACAFWTLLERHGLWDGALFFADADGRPRRYWRRRINMPVLGREARSADGQKLADAIGLYFKDKEARGARCECNQYKRGGKVYYFLYPQDHLQTSLEYGEEGQWIKRRYTPAFQIIFIHDDDERTLSIWHQGQSDRVKDMQVIFAEKVLGAKIEKERPKDTRVFDLSPFMQPDYQLSIPTELGIKSASIRKIAVRVMGPNPHTVRIELGDTAADHVLYDRLSAALTGVPRSLVWVSQVGIKATFDRQPSDTRERRRSFEISSPNSCSLENTPKDIVLRRMLAENGIEPRPKSQEADN